MKSLIVIPFLMIISFVQANDVDLQRLNSSSEGSHICYFSLNNEKEFEVMSDFTKKLNAHSTHKINVTEYQTENTNPKESFKKMIESGAKCDGLVISGHHTGAFGGKRAHGQLDINFIEKLSCNPEYKEFFENIKSLWLQGCRTLGQNIVPLTDTLTQDILSNENTAQHHVGRVGNVATEDSLEASFENLESNYAAVMDQDNPLGTRYLKAFPRASLFGWTKSSPGEKVGSQWSLPFHIAHISRVLDPDKAEYFRNPSQYMNAETAARYAEILTATLQRGNPEYSKFAECLGIKENDLILGWENHGRKHGGKDSMSFSNPDLKAFASFDEDKQQKLMEAKVLGCQMGSSDEDIALDALKKILSDSAYLGPNYNKILNLLKSDNQSLASEARELVQKSDLFKDYLKKKASSDETGILTKLELIQTSDELYGGNLNEEFKDSIINYSSRVLNIPDTGNWALQEYKRALVKRLDNLDYDIYKLLIGENSLKSYGIERVVKTLKYSKSPGALRFFESLTLDSKTNGSNLKEALNYLYKNKRQSELDNVLSNVLQHPQVTGKVIRDVSKIVYFKKPENAAELVELILNNEETESTALMYVVKSTDRIEGLNKKSIFLKVLSNRNTNKNILDLIEKKIDGLSEEDRELIEAEIARKRK